MEYSNEQQSQVNFQKTAKQPSVVFSRAAWNEQRYYLTILLYGLFPAVAVQKSVRDYTEYKK